MCKQLFIFVTVVFCILFFDSGKLISQNNINDADTIIENNTQDTINSKQKKIKLIYADFARSVPGNRDAQKLVGNVRLKHDSAFMYCDSAIFNKRLNNIEAFGNIRIIESDTLILYGDYLTYSGDTKIAEIRGNVKLVDPTTVLRTDILYFDRVKQTAYYNTGGVITNNDKTLKSIIGLYYSTSRDFHFFDNVIITDSTSKLLSDTVYYNTITEIAVSDGPTELYKDSNRLFCKAGVYDTKLKKSFLNKDIEVTYNEYIVNADSGYFDQNINYLEAYKNVIVYDTANSLKTWSQYLEYNKDDGYVFISDEAVARYIDDQDTAYIFADTIYAMLDNDKDSVKVKEMHAYHNAKVYHKSFQGKADSIVYNNMDSIAVFYINPVLWTETNEQITGDSIVCYFKDSSIYKIVAEKSGFILTQDEYGSFNQIKGDNVIIYLTNNNIDYIDIFHNVQSVFYLRESDGSMVGPCLIKSSDVQIRFDDNQLSQVVYKDNPQFEVIPEEKSNKARETLEGLKWRIHEKIVKKDFIKYK